LPPAITKPAGISRRFLFFKLILIPENNFIGLDLRLLRNG
jgi:hypothetical protein